MSIAILEGVRAALVDALVERLMARASSMFRRLGAQVCRAQAEALFSALLEDLQANQREALRTAVQGLVEALASVSLSFSDIRFFAHSLRSELLRALEAEPEAEALRGPIETWLFELVLVGSIAYISRREVEQQGRTVAREVEQLETQLAELQIALEEKSQLHEMLREASTPIAPVVRGILVVPLVGTFDAYRAEMLTEKLLNEIARLHARAAILDVSGVPIFDTASAQVIIRLARAVRLLGTKVFLVGLSPDGAKTIVDLGIDLSSLETFATLQDGLAHALVLQRLKIGPI